MNRRRGVKVFEVVSRSPRLGYRYRYPIQAVYRMHRTTKYLRLTLIFAGALCMGCGQGGSRTEQPIDAVIDPQPDRSQPITPKLNGSHQVYDKSGAREVYAALENPGFADIEAMLENAFADASAPRGRVLLARDVDSGDIIAVTRTPDGQLELSVNMKVGGNRFEANQFNVNSLATVISIFKAFYDTDARIRTLIEWDEVVE